MGTHATNYQSESIISIVLNFAFFSDFPKNKNKYFWPEVKKILLRVGRRYQGMNYENMPEIAEYLPPQMN